MAMIWPRKLRDVDEITGHHNIDAGQAGLRTSIYDDAHGRTRLDVEPHEVIEYEEVSRFPVAILRPLKFRREAMFEVVDLQSHENNLLAGRDVHPAVYEFKYQPFAGWYCHRCAGRYCHECALTK